MSTNYHTGLLLNCRSKSKLHKLVPNPTFIALNLALLLHVRNLFDSSTTHFYCADGHCGHQLMISPYKQRSPDPLAHHVEYIRSVSLLSFVRPFDCHPCLPSIVHHNCNSFAYLMSTPLAGCPLSKNTCWSLCPRARECTDSQEVFRTFCEPMAKDRAPQERSVERERPFIVNVLSAPDERLAFTLRDPPGCSHLDPCPHVSQRQPLKSR